MTRQDESITALRIQLHQLPCPTCGKCDLIPMLQCDYYPDGCLWVVRCTSCRTLYPWQGGDHCPVLLCKELAQRLSELGAEDGQLRNVTDAIGPVK